MIARLPLAVRAMVWIAGVAAVCIGLWARFAGLGYAPLSVDEYFLVRSIDDILRSGMPAFDCGGLYMRGLLQQYGAALLRLAGQSPELAPRTISAACSVASLPAAWLIARRGYGVTVAALSLILLSVSLWEVELGRFGRMYAPFQALFLWYCWLLVRYVVDGAQRAIWPMVLISVAAPLVWEGGVLLGASNILAVLLKRDSDQLKRQQWPTLAVLFMLGALCYWFVAYDFRGLGPTAFPPGFLPVPSSVSADIFQRIAPPITALLRSPTWLIGGAAAALLLAAPGLWWTWRRRTDHLLAIGMTLTLLACMAQQLQLAFATLVLLLLLRILRWRQLSSPDFRPVLLSLAGMVTASLWFAWLLMDWSALAEQPVMRRIPLFLYQFAQFPDVMGIVARPWHWAAPILGGALLVLIALATAVAIVDEQIPDAQRALVTLLVLLLLAVGSSDTPRVETRYVYFLYPVALIIATGTIAWLIRRIVSSPQAQVALTAGITVAGFAVTEDFNPQHLLRVNQPEALFRQEFGGNMQAHLEIRNDLRALAQWLQRNVRSDDIVVATAHGIDYYHPVQQFFVATDNPDFVQYTCDRGTVERWSNLPLIHSRASLSTLVQSAPAKVLLIVSVYDAAAIAALLVPGSHERVWSDSQLIVLQLNSLSR